MDPLHLLLLVKATCVSVLVIWFIHWNSHPTHASHTLSPWLFHNCYSQGQNNSSRLFPASPLPTPPAFPAGQEAPQLCSQLSHQLICQILETTLMWKEMIAVLYSNKKGYFVKDHYTSTEPLWTSPHTSLMCHLSGDFPLSEAPASCKLLKKPDTHSSWFRNCCNHVMISTACLSSRKLSSSPSCSFLTTSYFDHWTSWKYLHNEKLKFLE